MLQNVEKVTILDPKLPLNLLLYRKRSLNFCGYWH